MKQQIANVSVKLPQAAILSVVFFCLAWRVGLAAMSTMSLAASTLFAWLFLFGMVWAALQIPRVAYRYAIGPEEIRKWRFRRKGKTEGRMTDPSLQRLAALLEHAEPETKEAFRVWVESLEHMKTERRESA